MHDVAPERRPGPAYPLPSNITRRTGVHSLRICPLPPSHARHRRRPYLASECKSLPDAERWRREILREITKKVAEIQNGARGCVG